jgi:hypothetical protein
MPLSPSLWDEITPPQVWITLTGVELEEHDFIRLCIRVKEAGRRSISATVPVTRYAPTAQIVGACTKTIEALATAQQPLTAALLQEQMTAAVISWVDPF